MTRFNPLLAVALIAALPWPAFAQDHAAHEPSAETASAGGGLEAGVQLPEICTARSGAGSEMAGDDHARMAHGAETDAMPAEESGGATGGMDAGHQAMMTGMDEMNDAMMQGMMAEDIDVAFFCGMIPHHQGAISMARAELEHGDDPEAREMAEKIIAAQEQEIAEMLAWLNAQATE